MSIDLRADEAHLGYAPEREEWDAEFAAAAEDEDDEGAE